MMRSFAEFRPTQTLLQQLATCDVDTFPLPADVPGSLDLWRAVNAYEELPAAKANRLARIRTARLKARVGQHVYRIQQGPPPPPTPDANQQAAVKQATMPTDSEIASWRAALLAGK